MASWLASDVDVGRVKTSASRAALSLRQQSGISGAAVLC